MIKRAVVRRRLPGLIYLQGVTDPWVRSAQDAAGAHMGLGAFLPAYAALSPYPFSEL